MAIITTPTRKAVYRRDGYACALCNDPRNLQVHHYIKRSAGGSNNPRNLITLCPVCHMLAHGERLADYPDITPADVQQAIVEYLADYYAPNWIPWAIQQWKGMETPDDARPP